MLILLLCAVIAPSLAAVLSSVETLSLGVCPSFTTNLPGTLVPFGGTLTPTTTYCLEWDWSSNIFPPAGSFTLGPLDDSADTTTQEVYLNLPAIQLTGTLDGACPTGSALSSCKFPKTFAGVLHDFTAFRYSYTPGFTCLPQTGMTIAMDVGTNPAAGPPPDSFNPDAITFSVAAQCFTTASIASVSNAQQATTALAETSGLFTVTLGQTSTADTTICYSATLASTAKAGKDYQPFPACTVSTCLCANGANAGLPLCPCCATGAPCITILANTLSAPIPVVPVFVPPPGNPTSSLELTLLSSTTETAGETAFVTSSIEIGITAATPSIKILDYAGATGDPHINGPNGNQVEFRGQGGASYMLFESQQFAVTMRMAEYGPSVHYITAIGLRFQGAALYFDTHPRSLGVVAHMNQSLKPYNASVAHPAGNRNMFQLNLCPGVAILIVQKVTKINGKRVGFLNIEFDIPGCHDDFSGVLGQMYQCKWEKETFVWDPATEESFKVPRLLPPTKNAPCLLSHHFGKPYSGPKGGAASHEQVSP